MGGKDQWQVKSHLLPSNSSNHSFPFMQYLVGTRKTTPGFRLIEKYALVAVAQPHGTIERYGNAKR